MHRIHVIASSAAAIVIAVLAVSGCAGSDDRPETTSARPRTACTAVGCNSGIFVELRDRPTGTAAVALCARGRCARTKSDADLIQLELPRERRAALVTVTLVFRDRNGTVVASARRRARLRRLQPNGPDCPPVCFQAVFTWARGGLRR